MRRRFLMGLLGSVLVLGALVISWRVVHAQSATAGNASTSLLGGPRGVVKATIRGDVQTVDGVMVQLISQKNSIRTTVYTNERGQFEFPKLETGDYVLRIAR